MRKAYQAAAPAALPEFLLDCEARALARVGETRWAEMQREPDFPRPLWFGARGKRHARDLLVKYLMSRTESLSEHTAVRRKRKGARKARRPQEITR